MTNYKFRCEESNYRTSLSKENNDFDFKERQEEKQPYIAPIETHKKQTTSRLRVRKEPNGEVVKILDIGETVNVLEERGDGWAKLEDGNFVMSRFLK